MARKKTQRRFWTEVEDGALRRLYPHKRTEDVARQIGRTVSQCYQHAAFLGLKKSSAYLASPDAFRFRRGYHCGWEYRFPRGNKPWNAGKKGWTAGGRSAETRFKKGHYSARWDRSIYCVGALRVNTDGGLDIKTSEGLRGWEAMARYVWRTERGPLRKGQIVRPINGDPHDTRIENLRLGSRVDLMRENTLHRYPKEIARLIQLRGALNRQINRRTNAHDSRSA